MSSCPEITEHNSEFESTAKFQGLQKNYSSNKNQDEIDLTNKVRKKPLLNDLISYATYTKTESSNKSGNKKPSNKPTIPKPSSKACVLEPPKKNNNENNSIKVDQLGLKNASQNKPLNISKILKKNMPSFSKIGVYQQLLQQKSQKLLNIHGSNSITTSNTSVGYSSNNTKISINMNVKATTKNTSAIVNNVILNDKKLKISQDEKILDASGLQSNSSNTKAVSSTNKIQQTKELLLKNQVSLTKNIIQNIQSPKHSIKFDIQLKFKYKGKEMSLNLTSKENGLSIANLINQEFMLKLNLNNFEMLACFITQHINTLINYLSCNPIENIVQINNNYSRNLIDLDSLIPKIYSNKKLKLSLMIDTNQVNINIIFKIHFFFSSDDNIEQIIKDIIKQIPNNVTYNLDKLEESIKSCIINSINIPQQLKDNIIFQQKIPNDKTKRYLKQITEEHPAENTLFSVNIEISNLYL